MSTTLSKYLDSIKQSNCSEFSHNCATRFMQFDVDKSRSMRIGQRACWSFHYEITKIVVYSNELQNDSSPRISLWMWSIDRIRIGNVTVVYLHITSLLIMFLCWVFLVTLTSIDGVFGSFVTYFLTNLSILYYVMVSITELCLAVRLNPYLTRSVSGVVSVLILKCHNEW